MRLDRIILVGERNQTAQYTSQTVGAREILPVDRDRTRMPRGQASGEFVTEVRGDGGSGDAGYFGIVERRWIDTAHSIRKRKKNLIGETRDAGALREGAQKQCGLMQADKIGWLAKPDAQQPFQQRRSPAGGITAELSFALSQCIQNSHSLKCSVAAPNRNLAAGAGMLH